jgi:UPF0716 family protein affecting phage T7 exclusion
MGQAIVDVAFVLGFVATWLGFACLIFLMVFRFDVGGAWWNSLSVPHSERLRRAGLLERKSDLVLPQPKGHI